MDCNYPAMRCCYLLCHMGFPISSINGCDAKAAKRTRDLRNLILFHDFSFALANCEFAFPLLAWHYFHSFVKIWIFVFAPFDIVLIYRQILLIGRFRSSLILKYGCRSLETCANILA